jgi:hypothetical protein
MTPKERAKDLVGKFSIAFIAKQCALIAVDEILYSLEYNTWQNREILEYYEAVKQEIEKL